MKRVLDKMTRRHLHCHLENFLPFMTFHVSPSLVSWKYLLTKIQLPPNGAKFSFSIFTGPFLPCNDLFDWWTLRCGVWVVFLLALMGNGTVVFVLVFARTKMDVPRFLVCNLAIADFFMGVYLGNTYSHQKSCMHTFIHVKKLCSTWWSREK